MMNNNTPHGEYKIWDSQKQYYLPASYKTRKSASRAADRLDLEYGACRFLATWVSPFPQQLDKKSLGAGEKNA